MKSAVAFSLLLTLLLASTVEPSSLTSGNLVSLLALFAALGLPLAVLAGVYYLDRTAPAAKVSVALALLFLAIDALLLLGAGMAAILVGALQLLVALVLGVVAWAVRRAA